MSTLGQLLLIFLMIVLSGFFSGAEIALTSVNRVRLKTMADGGSKTAVMAQKICDRFEQTLTTILIGNNVVNITASAMATVLAVRLLSGLDADTATLIATAVLTVVLLTFGEIIPKVIAKQHAETVSRLVAWPIRILSYCLYPFVYLIVRLIRVVSSAGKKKDGEEDPTVTEEELVSLIETADEEGVINEEKSDLLQSAIEFSDITVKEVLTPRTELTAIDIDDSLEEIRDEALESTYSRLPVYEESIDNIIGILHLNRLFKALADHEPVNIREMMIEPCFFHQTMKLPAALDEMRRRQVHMAVVVDEFGGTMGIVTMEDILEEIVGDIWDESDEIVDELVSTGESTFEVNGDMSITDFFEEMDVDDRDFDSEYSTVGGWAVEMLGSEPHVGDSFTYKNLYLIVTEMDDTCVTKLSVLVSPPEKDEEE